MKIEEVRLEAAQKNESVEKTFLSHITKSEESHRAELREEREARKRESATFQTGLASVQEENKRLRLELEQERAARVASDEAHAAEQKQTRAQIDDLQKTNEEASLYLPPPTCAGMVLTDSALKQLRESHTSIAAMIQKMQNDMMGMQDSIALAGEAVHKHQELRDKMLGVIHETDGTTRTRQRSRVDGSMSGLALTKTELNSPDTLRNRSLETTRWSSIVASPHKSADVEMS